MKLLLDNNLPHSISKVFSGHECLVVRDVLRADAKDNEILIWCKANDVDILITKDKQFSWVIAGSNVSFKCVLCTFGNMSVYNTIDFFEKRKTAIEYFAKTSSKILEI
jgi:predicted nuclease of predicted toxin-antitoxin system